MLENWTSEIPKLPKNFALVLFIVNIFFPGVGTLISACVGEKFLKSQLIVGLLQLILAAFIVGWVWSIIWGYLIYKKSGAATP